MSNTSHRRWAGSFIMLALTMTMATSFLTPNAWAEQHLHTLRSGIQTQLKTDINGQTATAGQPFEAVLKEDVRYKNQVLPAGTDFQGQISRVEHSKHFGRPGYVVLDVQQAQLPNGQTIDLNQYPDRVVKIHEKGSKTFIQSVVTQLPYTAAGLAVSIPLHEAGGVDTLPAGAIALGARTAVGAVAGLFRPAYRDKPLVYRFCRGALDGTGIPTVVGIVGKYPEAEYVAGDPIKLYMDKQATQSLFAASGTSTSSTQPATHNSLQQ